MKFSSLVPTNMGSSLLLVDYLAARFTYYDRSQWQNLILEGRICVDEHHATPDTCVTGGQTVVYDAGDFDEPPADLNFTIIYEDEWLFAVNKTGNLLVHRAGKSFKNNLMYQLRYAHNPPYPESYSIHRLDRNTSGVVLIAKSPSIQATISEQFLNRQVLKRYIAFVEGNPDSGIGTICKPIGKDPDSTGGSRFCIDAKGKEALTDIESINPLCSFAAQLTLHPLTGRTHQLRVHCASIGHPILGDTTYGSSFTITGIAGNMLSKANNSIIHQRHALHCSQLSFYHPWLKKDCSIEADLPEDLKQLKRELLSGDIK